MTDWLPSAPLEEYQTELEDLSEEMLLAVLEQTDCLSLLRLAKTNRRLWNLVRTRWGQRLLDRQCSVAFAELSQFFGRPVTKQQLGLQATHSGLSYLPDSIGVLQDLRELNLDYNVIRTLPESIGMLARLERLYINNNELEELPPTIGELRSLQELWLANNRLPSLPHTLGKLQALQTLNLRDNALQRLPDVFDTLPNLRRILLEGNPIQTLPPTLLSSLRQGIVQTDFYGVR